MSNILRRPMFRGGRVDGRGTGITSGLDDRQNYKGGGAVERYKKYLQDIKSQQPALSLSDYLQIASAGARIAGAPSMGGGISGALTTAAPILADLGTGLAGSFAAREKGQREEAAALTGLEIEEAKATKPYEVEVKANFVMSRYNNLIAAEKDETKKAALIAKRDREIADIYRGLDISDKYKILGNTKALEEALATAADYFDTNPDQVKNYGKTKAEAIYAYAGILLSQAEAQFYTSVTGEKRAEGGRVGYQEGGEVMMDPMQQETDMEVADQEQPMQLSYEELRARLPQEITDDIVKLLAGSYEALADFAQIQTQADVNAFNSKYQVNLVLPQEA